MKISLIVAHPNPRSFNHALAHVAHASLQHLGHDVLVHDLYEEGFDPRLTERELASHTSTDPLVERHARELQQAEGLVLIHPIWFDAPPAIMKGWVDRVVREGTAFERGSDGGFVGLLQARQAVVITTQNAPLTPEGDAVHHFWCEFVLPATGTPARRIALGPIVGSSDAVRRAWLDDVAAALTPCFPAP